MRAAAAAFVIAAAVLVARAQQPPPTFRTEANYVRVDVYPTRDGTPVADLAKDDFELLESGVPQRIEQFEHIQIRARTIAEGGREPNTVAESREMLKDPRARVFVLFLDLGHVNQVDARRVAQPLIDALDNLIGPDDLIAVMTPTMSVADITFARRTTSVRAFLDREWWGERDSTVLKDPVEQMYCACYAADEPSAAGCPAVAQQMILRRREKMTLDALEDLVSYLRVAREERKAIIAITNGWRLYGPDATLERIVGGRVPTGPTIGVDPRTGKLSADDTRNNPLAGSRAKCDADRMNLAHIDDEREYRDLFDQANRANASFYPVNPAGLEAPATIAGIRDSVNRTEMLRTLAENTDGIAVVSSNDLSKGFRRVVDDLSSYYLLGYYSTGKLDGRFHAITVRVKRPGVQIRARRGYLAALPADATSAARSSPAAAPSAGGGSDTAVIDAAIGPLAGLSRELPVRLLAAAGWTTANQPAIWTVGELGPGEEWRGGAEADVMLVAPGGATAASAHATVAPGTRTFRVALTASEPLAPGDYTVRVRARGTASTAASTDAARVTLAASPTPTGAVVIRRGPSTGNRDAATADLRFRRGEQIRVEVPAAGAAAPSARLLDRSGKPLAIPVAAAVRDDSDGTRWQTAQLALAPLAAGDYVIEVTSGSGSARTLVAFRVVP